MFARLGTFNQFVEAECGLEIALWVDCRSLGQVNQRIEEQQGSLGGRGGNAVTVAASISWLFLPHSLLASCLAHFRCTPNAASAPLECIQRLQCRHRVVRICPPTQR